MRVWLIRVVIEGSRPETPPEHAAEFPARDEEHARNIARDCLALVRKRNTLIASRLVAEIAPKDHRAVRWQRVEENPAKWRG